MADFESLFGALVHQESGGRHRSQDGSLLSSGVGAQGITQVMPGTGKSPGYGVRPVADDSEGEYLRFGRDYLGAMMKEFGGDSAKALAAYNWGPGAVQKATAKYGETWLAHAPAETQQYVRNIHARAGAGTGAATPAAPAAGAPQVEATTSPTLGTVDYALTPAPGHDPSVPETVAVDPFAMGNARALMAGRAVSNASGDTAAWDAGIRQDMENDAGFLEAAGAAFSDPNVMFEVAGYNLLKGALADEPVDPNYDFHDQYNKVMGSLTVEEREYLFENGGGGQGDFDRAVARIHSDRELGQVYENAGALASLSGQLVAGFASPTNYVSGAIVGRAFKAVANAARIATTPTRAGAAFVAENVVGNVLQESMLDAMGERRTASDYALAAGMGAAFSVPFLPGTVRRAQADATDRAIADLTDSAGERVGPSRELEANRDVEEITTTINEQGQPLTLGRVMPADVEANVRMMAGEDAPADAPQATAGAAKEDGPMDFPTLGGGEDLRIQAKDFADSFDIDAPDAPQKAKDFFTSQDYLTLVNDPELDPGLRIKLEQLEYSMSWGASDMRAGEVLDVTSPHQWSGEAIRKIVKDPDLEGLYTAREVLDALVRRKFNPNNSLSNSGQRILAGDLTTMAKWFNDNEKYLKEWMERTPLALIHRPFGGHVQMRTGIAEVFTSSSLHKRPAGMNRGQYLDYAMSDELMARVALHELMHTRTIHLIEQFRVDPDSLPKEIRASLHGMERIRQKLENHFRKTDPARLKGDRSQAAYAALDLHEMFSQLTSSYGMETRQLLSQMAPNPGFAGRLSSALEEVWLHIKGALGLPHGAPRGTALGEALFHMERIALYDHKTVDVTGADIYSAWPARAPSKAEQRMAALRRANGVEEPSPAAGAPAQPVNNPMAVIAAQQKFADRMYEAARSWIAENPIDTSRLNTLVSKFGALVSDGIQLARSNNPILQQMASMVAEISTGAAGRRSTVAIRATHLEEQLVGLGLRRYDGAYEQWKRAKNVNKAAGWWNDASKGDLRQQFDREVYIEILDRQNSQYEGRVRQASRDPAVIEAANALEEGFKRGLDAQKNGNTIGSSNLPENSKGYIPRSLDGRILHSDPAAIPHIIQALSNHWTQTIGWEPDFSKQFAEFYLERARTRALGNRNVDLNGASVDGTALIRETLEEMANGATTPEARDLATRGMLTFNRKAGSSQTKARLDIDLLQTLPNGKRIMDYYAQNPVLLYRKYMHRVAGEVALTEFGVPGARGVRYLREAVVLHKDPAEMATEEELAAFDRLTAQLLGRPVPGEVVSQTATTFRLFASMARLGGAGITQFQEVWNAVHHIGLRSSLAALSQLPRMIGEVGRLKKGQKVGGVLGDLATLGGEVGMRDYYLVAPLDAPDQRSLTHGDDVGIVGRLIRAGSHIQQRMSFMQGIHAAQHRSMAEQILLKAAKMLRSGEFLKPETSNSTVAKSLRDMGFSDRLITQLAATVDQWATFDPQGNLVKLDVTMMPSRADAEEFMQAIHRGTRQIIQGTYPGETGAWAHNDWLKLLLQFRTFSIISADKQFARTRMNHGMAQAAGYLLASGAAAIPLHLARVQVASLGREDREEYVDKATSWQALVQASMNYTALSGLGGDAVELAMVGYSGWSGNEIESVKGRGKSLVEQIPAVGVIEQGFRVASGKGSVTDALNLLPGSRLPFLVPLVNMTRDTE